jgi:hypothetical protein
VVISIKPPFVRATAISAGNPSTLAGTLSRFEPSKLLTLDCVSQGAFYFLWSVSGGSGEGLVQLGAPSATGPRLIQNPKP